MFNVDMTTNTISLSRGDTGAVTISVTGYIFGENDRALFSIKSGGQIIKQKVYEIVNNEFTVTFFNADTEMLSPGDYSWDVRYVINPYYSEDGDIIDGDQILTPNNPMTVSILSVVGDI